MSSTLSALCDDRLKASVKLGVTRILRSQPVCCHCLKMMFLMQR